MWDGEEKGVEQERAGFAVRDVNPFPLGHADAVPPSKVLKWPLRKTPNQRKSQFSQTLRESPAEQIIQD